MKHNLVLSILFLSFMLALSTTKADLLDCTEEKLKPLSDDINDVVLNFFKRLACDIKNGDFRVKEHAMEIATGWNNQPKKWGEKAKDFGSNIKAKLPDYRQRVLARFGVRDTPENRAQCCIYVPQCC